MSKEYLCLECGSRFVVVPSAKNTLDKKCSRCGSANIMKLNGESIFSFSGGG